MIIVWSFFWKVLRILVALRVSSVLKILISLRRKAQSDATRGDSFQGISPEKTPNQFIPRLLPGTKFYPGNIYVQIIDAQLEQFELLQNELEESLQKAAYDSNLNVNEGVLCAVRYTEKWFRTLVRAYGECVFRRRRVSKKSSLFQLLEVPAWKASNIFGSSYSLCARWHNLITHVKKEFP